jgi:hypothetical protein
MNEDTPQSTQPFAGELKLPPQSLPTHVEESPETKAAVPPAIVAPSDSVQDDMAKQDFLWHTHSYLNEYARFADTKAAFSGAISGTLLGCLYSTKAFLPLVTLSLDRWSIAAWLAAAAGLTLCLSVGFAIWTIRPRLKTAQQTGYIYWGNITAYQEIDRFKIAFHSQSPRALNDCLLQHVFDISKHVCVPKYRAVSICLLLLLIGACLSIATLALQDHAGAHGAPSRLSPLSVRTSSSSLSSDGQTLVAVINKCWA